MPSNARKNATMSLTTSEPTTREIVRRNACTAAPAMRMPVRVGTISNRKIAVVEEAQQPLRRVEEVERVPARRGVHDDEVEPAFLVELVQLLHRHVLLGARQRRGDVPVEGVLEDALGLSSGDDAYRVTRPSNVDFVSSIIAESAPPGTRSPFGSQRSVAISRGSFESSSRPSALARRLAGSMVTTSERRPRRAPSIASTAALVVLPTPPLPQHTTT